MKLIGTVSELAEIGDGVQVTICNVRWKQAAEWRDYSPNITISMTHKQAAAYKIGNRATIEVKP